MFAVQGHVNKSAILAVGSILEKPVALDGTVVIRPCPRLTLSVDHRVIPSIPAAQFLQAVKRLLEEPLRLGFYGTSRAMEEPHLST
jgi:pyruvate/2-oxoglutarate dehydrogenase complex dihydrolipoamide acyltransferase (E2) component